MNIFSNSRTGLMIAAVVVSLMIALTAVAGQVDPFLQGKLDEASPMEKIQVIVYMQDQLDLPQMENSLRSSLSPGERVPVKVRYETILTALQAVAERTQPAFMQRIVSHESAGLLSVINRFWIRNIVVLSATPEAITEIAAFPEVDRVYFDGMLYRDLPVAGPIPSDSNPESSEPGLRAINAHKLWELGYTGTGRIVMNIDTGVEGNNLSYNTRWRGAQPGVPASAAWFDPSGGSTFPNDCDGHGTHTMGTMTGLYSATNETLGVAPSAHWIASNSLCGGGTHTSRSIASFQWAANPDGNPNTLTDVPDAITCSWFDPNVASTQCEPTAGGYGPVFEALEALGTAIVFSAGNNGPGAGSVTPPKNRLATAADIFSIGAVDGNNSSYPIASFSSRGPSSCPGPDSLRIKPEVSAPGVNVRSASGTNSTSLLSGTSMATPHVAGAIAVLREVAPFLTGTEIKHILMNTAQDLGTPGEDNNYGHGMIDMWAAYQQLPLSMGYVNGQVTSSTTDGGGNPLSGVAIDFAESVQQLTDVTDGSGNFLASARIDTQFTSATYTLRAQKFGYISYSDTITIALDDTVTRNITLTPAPGGTLEVHAHLSNNSPVHASVQVIFAGQTVVNDSTDEVSGLFSTPLPVGSYTVIVDPPSPYATRTFDPVSISAGTTTSVDALVRSVFEYAPASVSDTLVVGQVGTKTISVTNTTTDSVRFRVSDDEALTRISRLSKPKPLQVQTYTPYHLPKDVKDPNPGYAPTEGRGGPDPFGYEWIDSDEPGGPIFNWVDITGVGTSIPSTQWVSSTGTANADDGKTDLALPFAFPFYGTDYTSLKLVTNGWLSFETSSTLTSYINSPIPSTGTAAPNLAVYPWWDDQDLRTSGTVHYYHDAANSRFIIQYTNVPHYGTTEPGVYTYQVILYENGSMLCQYLSMQQTLTSATIGIENADGTMGLQVVHSAAYMHDNLAILFHLPDAPWISENPTSGTIPPSSIQDITVEFNAGGLTAGTNYSANIFLEAQHPDVEGAYTIPASLSIELADSAVLIVNKGSITYPATQINTTRHDTIIARNGGLQTLSISSITSTHAHFAVSPASMTLAPSESAAVAVSYTPLLVGADTGRVLLVSNSQGSSHISVILSGNALAAPDINVTPTALGDTLQTGASSTAIFSVTNTAAPPSSLLLVSLSESASWLSVSPSADTLAAGESQLFTVSFEATGLPIGVVNADITITSNDPSTPSSVVSCLLDVRGGPVISVSPDSLFRAMGVGSTATDTIVIRNAGASDLTWTIADVPAPSADGNNGGDPRYPVFYGPSGELYGMMKGDPDVYQGPAVTEGQGGPDGAGYRWIDSDEPSGPVFNWVDISSTGTLIDENSAWVATGTFNAYDEGYISIPLPFPFQFYDNTYSSAYISSNGLLMFQIPTANNFTNAAIPTAAGPSDNFIAPFWDDLQVSGVSKVYYGMSGTDFVMQWVDIHRYNGTVPNYTFEIILKPGGQIIVQYLAMSINGGTLTSHSTGIENQNGSIGLQMAFNPATAYIHNNLAVLVYRDISWLSESPTQGTIAPGDSTRVAVTYNTTGMPAGSYLGYLEISSNDLNSSPTLIPVRMDVAVGVTEAKPGIPEAFELVQNYPNPFNPTTRIEFGLPEAAEVTLRVFDLLGREVRLLAEGNQNAGYFSAEWDGRNMNGSPVSSGMYFYRLEARSVSGQVFTSLRKMMLMK
ncbi:MAG: S8 family serine peptidase [Bacteroidota bacterium]